MLDRRCCVLRGDRNTYDMYMAPFLVGIGSLKLSMDTMSAGSLSSQFFNSAYVTSSIVVYDGDCGAFAWCLLFFVCFSGVLD